MAHCKIIFEGDTYVNATAFRAAYGLGDTGLIKAVATKETFPKTIFDDTIYLVNKEQLAKCKEFIEKTQDVDDAILKLEVLLDDTGLRIIKIPKAALKKTIRYKGFTFIRLADIPGRDKYTVMHRLPLVQVCGSKYVAINVKNSSVRRPIVVKVGAS
jgi:hypothetical protein